MSLKNPRTIQEAMAALQKLPGNIRIIATAKLASSVKDKILTNWNAGQDPYGKTWAAKADGSASHLFATGDMQGSLRVTPQSAQLGGVVVSIDTPFEFHQYGTSRMPARPLLPVEGRGVPADWRQLVVDAVDEASDK